MNLSASFDAVVPESEAEKLSTCYFVKDGILVRLPHASTHDDWSVLTQIVIPNRYRTEILKMAHDNPLAGHLGVNKTYDCILWCFFWPGLKCDVRQHCKTGILGVLSTAAAADLKDVVGPSLAVVQGRLQNSAMLSKLDECFLHLTESQREDVVQLIKSNVSLFSDVPTRTDVLEHDIDVGDSSPIKQHAYRVNPEKRARLQQQVDYMLENNTAEQSSSSWSSPCLLAAKADSSDRFCTDFRKVNGVTKPDCYPLPRIGDCVDHVGSATYVTKLDLLKGYWQIPLTQRDKEITAFVTTDAFLQYMVMPFGVRNAPATFQRFGQHCSAWVTCEAYLDDIVVYSSSWEDHVQQLGAVFVWLRDTNLILNLVKCEFGQATVTYLGKVVGRGQDRPVEVKVEAILSFLAPASRRQLRRFLGWRGIIAVFVRTSWLSLPRSQTSLAQKGVFIGQTTVSVLLIVLRHFYQTPLFWLRKCLTVRSN